MTEKVPRDPLFVHCAMCQHEWALCFFPVDAEAFGRLKHARCPLCRSKKVVVGEVPRETPTGAAVAWLSNGDTGTSSLTIWNVLMGETPTDPSIPRDPDDFGRCYRLLRVMPAWRARLGEVADAYDRWRPLVEAWDELTALYERELPTGRCPQLYDRMRALRGDR